MTDGWKAVSVSEVRVGDVVRTQTGVEVEVSRIEEAFFGMPTMLAFIQDTAHGWFKCPQPVDGQIDVKTAAA
ncbi:MAG TPA: hypothetical protein VHX15_05075 [Frankiaceae bacterium]|jgi:hypothetical protein|nr:hypothetical protein [Frankiaceae bacterium]